MQPSFDDILDTILRHDERYPREAYFFVREALDHTQQKVHKDAVATSPEHHRHVTGQQLLEGIRDYALEQFGPMTLHLFEAWNIRRCEDFGDLVFNLVDHGQGMFGKTEKDSRADFSPLYDFHEVFSLPFLPVRRRPRRSMRKV